MARANAPKGWRRKKVKKLGKRLFRGTFRDYLARQSKIPDQPVLDASLFPWAEEVASHWLAIRAELEAQLKNRAAMPNFQDISPDQYRISPDDMWKTFVFMGFGETSQLNRELCPETTRALESVPNLQNAFFSVLAPGKHVPRHRGVTKGLVRCHLGLKVPQQKEQCRMWVGGQVFFWEEGELVFFDDTYPHAVRNDTDEERAVLLFDFERPMTRRGQWLSRTMLMLLRRTAYFRDARRNQQTWEAQYRKVLERQAG